MKKYMILLSTLVLMNASMFGMEYNKKLTKKELIEKRIQEGTCVICCENLKDSGQTLLVNLPCSHIYSTPL